MTERIFTAADAWAGGSYELAIELGPTDDDRLSRTLQALWSSRDLDGCYRLGVIGWDGGDADAARVAATGVPAERYEGYLVPGAGRLRWFAPNRGAPFTFAT